MSLKLNFNQNRIIIFTCSTLVFVAESGGICPAIPYRHTHSLTYIGFGSNMWKWHKNCFKFVSELNNTTSNRTTTTTKKSSKLERLLHDAGKIRHHEMCCTCTNFILYTYIRGQWMRAKITHLLYLKWSWNLEKNDFAILRCCDFALRDIVVRRDKGRERKG